MINSTDTLRDVNDYNTSNPDVNSAPQIDEDGDGDEVGSADDNVNDTSAKHPDLDEEDDTPAILSVVVTTNGKHTDILARIAGATGAVNKRFVLPGHLTAKRLAEALMNVGNW